MICSWLSKMLNKVCLKLKLTVFLSMCTEYLLYNVEFK